MFIFVYFREWIAVEMEAVRDSARYCDIKELWLAARDETEQSS